MCISLQCLWTRSWWLRLRSSCLRYCWSLWLGAFIRVDELKRLNEAESVLDAEFKKAVSVKLTAALEA